MVDFEEWGKATDLKNRIIDLDNYENVETERIKNKRCIG